MSEQATTLYDAVGGSAFFEVLVDRFYEGVAADTELLALYPDPEDLGPARRRLALFLAEYWGGPPEYSAERGHPRLRMRHASFPIGARDRDRWLAHMRDAVAAMGAPQDVTEALLGYFETGAEAMRNR